MSSRDPVPIGPRKSFTQKKRLEILLAHGGRCGICGEKISGSYEIEHRIPHAISGRNDDANLYPAHKECHALKTTSDRKDIAKCDRIIRKSDPETRKPPRMKSRPFPKGGKTKWPKQKFERREK